MANRTVVALYQNPISQCPQLGPVCPRNVVSIPLGHATYVGGDDASVTESTQLVALVFLMYVRLFLVARVGAKVFQGA